MSEVVQEVSLIFRETREFKYLLNVPVEALGLGIKLSKYMRENEMFTAAEAVNFLLDETLVIRSIGFATLRKGSIKAKDIFRLVGHDSSIEKINLLLDLPELLVPPDDERQLTEILDEVLLKLVGLSSKKDRDVDIIKKRFGLTGEAFYTLQELGDYYGITRERVRQIESEQIKKLKNILTHRYEKTSADIPERLKKQFSEIQRDFGLLNYVIERDLVSILDIQHGSLNRSSIKVLMNLLGYEDFSGENQRNYTFDGCLWFKKKKIKTKGIVSLIKFALDEISSTINKETEEFRLISKLRRKNKEIPSEAFKNILSCVDVLEMDEKVVRVKSKFLRNAPDKAFRVLAASEKPLHLTEIVKRINVFEEGKQTRVRNLSNQLVSDERFKPIGRSGYWALCLWEDIENVNIEGAIEKVLSAAGTPLSVTRIKAEVKELRPHASDSSIYTYISQSEKFQRKQGKVLLSAWHKGKRPVPVKAKRMVASEISILYNRAIDHSFGDSERQKLSWVVKEVKRLSSLKEGTIRNRIQKDPRLTISENSGTKYLYFDENKKVVKKKLLRERVQEVIRGILHLNPNVEYRKADLYKMTREVVECQAPTFYSYLNELDEFKTIKRKNSFFVVFEKQEKQKRVLVNRSTVETIYNNSLKVEINNAIKLLTVDHVDSGLRRLSLIFEEQVNCVIKSLIDEGKLKNKDAKLPLVQKLDKLKEYKKISNKELVHMNMIRFIRNDLSHNLTRMDDKQELYNKAYYISELLILNIKYLSTQY